LKIEHQQATELAAQSLKWTSLLEILSRVATPVVFIVLAAILSPADFGVLASATVVVTFMQVFIDNGLGRALIQYDAGDLDTVANSTFWTNAAVGVALYVLTLVSAQPVARFFDQEILVPVVRVLGLQVLFAAAASVQQALLQRNFRFKSLLIARAVSTLISSALCVVLALKGYGVWSLVGCAVAATAINSALICVSCARLWRPRWQVDWRAVTPVLAFGMWTLAEALALWSIFWGDTIIGGYFLGAEQLGIYRMAGNLVLLLFAITLNPLLSLLYPYLSRLQTDAVLLGETFEKVVKVIAAVALPMGLGAALAGPPIIDLIFGPRWAGLSVVFALLIVREAIAWLTAANSETYKSVGRPDITVKIIVFAMIIYVPALVIAAPNGLVALAWVKLLLTVPVLVMHLVMTKRLLRVSGSYLWMVARSAIVGCVAMCFALLLIRALLADLAATNPLIMGGILVVAGFIVYVTVVSRVDPALLEMFRRLVRRVATR
jgi:O-antigen/teichoic acid export membrane protein